MSVIPIPDRISFSLYDVLRGSFGTNTLYFLFFTDLIHLLKWLLQTTSSRPCNPFSGRTSIIETDSL
uniref:Uncharacterized protein n=1 Tax=Anguilla anguilla TaxID=7936 RepID=A0A0E9PUL7_ANGAN